MAGETQHITSKYRITVEEFQTWSKYSGDKSQDMEEWTQTDQITTGKRASLAAFLRGLANELDPAKTATRGYDA